MHLNDQMLKSDTAIESLLRKIERQYLDITEKLKYDFKVKTADGERIFPNFFPILTSLIVGLDQYLTNFKWDDAKFPRNVHMADIVKTLNQVSFFSFNF